MGNTMKYLIEGIEKLGAEELQRANLEHREFASDHEAYAVILEEFEEVKEEFETLQANLPLWWNNIKTDAEITPTQLLPMQLAVTYLCAEGVQVLAMIHKYLNYLNNRDIS